MVAERHSGPVERAAWQQAEKLRIAAQYPGEDEDLSEAILATPWRDTLESDVRQVYEQHRARTVELRDQGHVTFPSDDLFWLNVALLLPDYKRFLSQAQRETPAGRAFMVQAQRIYPPAHEVIARMDVK